MDGKKLVGIGLLIIIVMTGFFTWKDSAVTSAQADIDKLGYEIALLNDEIKDLEEDRKDKETSADEKKEIAEEIKLIREEITNIGEQGRERDLELREEKVDQKSNNFMLMMIRWIGLLVLGLGMMMMVKDGSDYEKVGALIAIGFIVQRLV